MHVFDDWKRKRTETENHIKCQAVSSMTQNVPGDSVFEVMLISQEKGSLLVNGRQDTRPLAAAAAVIFGCGLDALQNTI